VTTPARSYAWTARPEPAFPIPPYAKYLRGVKIVLDPGHGGHADRPNWKRGPTGLREEEVNLRVAQFLREFLEATGAEVHLTRTSDIFLDPDNAADLTKRIGLANDLQADLFLSIHHNGLDDPAPNYTSLFYHGSPDDSPASRCAARYLLTGLSDALRLEEHLSCAVLSDQMLSPIGLHVLREARVPAVLGEASFHSNPAEEQRLRDPAYNRAEAYGYFLGLARWAQAGLPRVRLVEPEDGRVHSGSVVVALEDGLSGRGGWGADTVKIAADSLLVKLDGHPVPFKADFKSKLVRIELPSRHKANTLDLQVDFENVFGQHVLHPHMALHTGGST
jgi:N-acetylmuramoyl-L-alanine amidase